MASNGIKISALPAASTANATDQLEVNQGGTSRRVTLEQLLDVTGGAYLPLAGGTLTGPLVVGDLMTLDGLGLDTACLQITAPFTDGVSSPLLDLVDLNMSGATPSTGFDIRFFGRDTNDDVQLGAIINGGMATRDAGSYKGDIDFLVYGPDATVQAGVALSGIYVGFVPISPDTYRLGDSTLRWSNTYSVLGNFSGLLTGTTAAFSGAVKALTTLSVGSEFAVEAIDLTGNLFLRSAAPIIYSAGSLSVQSAAAQPVMLFSGAGAKALIWTSTGLLQFLELGAAAPALKPTISPATLAVRNSLDNADAAFQALTFSSGSASPILASRTTITGGSTANAPTLTTGPVTGNPTKWLPYDDNGTTRYIPSW